jgi:hypothetical protein
MIGFFGTLIWIITRFLMKKYKKSWKWIIKYSLARQKFSEDDVKYCMEAIGNNQSLDKVKQFLLLDGCDDNRFNEIVWIYNKINKQLKGGY